VFKYRQKLLYLLTSITVAFSLIVTDIKPTQAIPWGELIYRGIQVIQLNNINDRQEKEIGNQIRQQLISERKVKLYRDENLSAYVNQIGDRLVAVSGRPNLDYNFEIVDNPQVNAFATMGGFIYLHTGLLKMADNEAELASVIAHEIAHVVARHSQKQLQQQAVTQGLLSVAGLDSTKIVQLGVALAVDLPYSRQDEYEADSLGLEMLKAAGYAPQPMVDFMGKLAQTGGKTPTLLSTHPASLDRAIALQKQISPLIGYQGDGLDEQAYRYQIRSLR